MAGQTVRQQLEQDRTFAGSALGGRTLHGLVDREHVHAVHRFPAYPVGRGAIGDARDTRHLVQMCRCAVEVVLADEDHRQVPYRRQIDAFVKCAFGRGAVAEEARHHLALPLHFQAQRHARGDRDPAADNRDRRHHALVHVAHVH